MAAAADLQFALDDILQAFRPANPGVTVEAVYGSSGNFYTQIRNQAPFDVFLSADLDYARRLASDGLAAPDSLFTYATGRIVLWTPDSAPVDVTRLQIRALEAGSVRHVALANPQHAPYGRAAEAALHSLGIYEKVASKIVVGENIAQTLQLVQSGGADAGIVALSLALAPAVRGHGRYWEIPTDAYPKIEQGGVILNRAAKSKAAWEFRSFLMSESARDKLKNYGFGLSAK